MLLPVVLLLGIATYVRLVQINSEEFKIVLAMNRLRHAYLKMAPGLEPYFTTGHHDDERGMVTTYMLDHPTQLRHGENMADAQTEAERLAAADGHRLISPGDEPALLAGVGTLYLELFETVPDVDAIARRGSRLLQVGRCG